MCYYGGQYFPWNVYSNALCVGADISPWFNTGRAEWIGSLPQTRLSLLHALLSLCLSAPLPASCIGIALKGIDNWSIIQLAGVPCNEKIIQVILIVFLNWDMEKSSSIKLVAKSHQDMTFLILYWLSFSFLFFFNYFFFFSWALMHSLAHFCNNSIIVSGCLRGLSLI